MQAGKSTISNYIAEREDIASTHYRPTVAVRILEFEKEAPKNPKRPGTDKVLVELWDVSGDTKYRFNI
jgi:Rab-like protein 5